MFRLVLVKLTKAGLLFDGKGSDELMTRWSWKSRQVTTVERFVQLVDKAVDSTVLSKYIINHCLPYK